MATIGTILIQAANQAGGITGSGAPNVAGMGAGGGEGVKDLKHQKLMEKQGAESNTQGEKAPKFWTAAFKKMGIQMGLAGILKQSQIFTSTIGSLFQIFGAFVDVMLAPFVPLFIPAIRWLARQLPTVAKAAQATAEGISKVIKAVWSWFFGGKFKENVKSLFTGAVSGVVDGIKGAFSGVLGFFTDNPFADWVAKLTKGMWDGITGWYDKTLAGKRVAMADGGWIGKIGFTFPGGGGGLSDVEKAKGQTLEYMAEEGMGLPTYVPKPKPKGPSITNPLTGANMSIPGGQHLPFAGDDEGWQDWALAAGGGYAGLKATQVGLTSMKGGSVLDRVLGPKKPVVKPISKVGKVSNIMRRALSFTDDTELNFLRKIPGTGLLKAGVNLPVKGAELAAKAVLGSGRTLAQAMGLMSGGVDDMAKAAAAGGPTRFGGPGTSGFADDLGQMNQRAPTFSDDLAQMKSKGPTKLSRAVNAFNNWVKKTGPKLKSAAGAGARAFQNVYDEGLSLADDVVKLAKVTPGMGVVGKIVSVGFKRVIPGIAGAYMVGETIQDVWKIVKSDAPWLGDWKSLDAYKAEAMGSIFGGQGANALNPVGMLTGMLGKAQSAFGLGSNISDWQDQIIKNQKEKGVLSSGKLMDAIIRGTTGGVGAALSTFFPGLGTIAGTALYEGGRYATTGINVPGLGQLGGDVDKYGPAVDFSDRIIQAIEAGWGKGVNMVEIR